MREKVLDILVISLNLIFIVGVCLKLYSEIIIDKKSYFLIDHKLLIPNFFNKNHFISKNKKLTKIIILFEKLFFIFFASFSLIGVFEILNHFIINNK